jgi:hypothetical protein
MRVEQLYLNRVRAKLKKLQALETRLERALTKEYPDILEDERGAIWAEYERLTGPSDEDGGSELQNPEEIRKLLEPIYERMKIKKAPRN